MVYWRNPYLPDDLRGSGNVERVIVTLGEWDSMLVQYPDVDIITQLNGSELALARENYPDDLYVGPSDAVFYFGLAQEIPPFDNVHVRRAFSAMLDRERFVEEVRQGRNLPMIHFTPPGAFGALPIDEAGIGYDPDFARSEMVLAGYPNCENFPPILITAYQGAGSWGEFVAASAERELGCDPYLFTVEELSWGGEPLDPTAMEEIRPNLWTGGWGGDFPDAHAWLYLGISDPCDEPPDIIPYGVWAKYNFTLVPACSPADDLLTQAAIEADPVVRAALYAQVEEQFFGPEGEQRVISLFARIQHGLRKPWITGPFETDPIYGMHYDWYTIAEH
jgi:ABC-type oligopeptide transport system substrate-binding subunit